MVDHKPGLCTRQNHQIITAVENGYTAQTAANVAATKNVCRKFIEKKETQKILLKTDSHVSNLDHRIGYVQSALKKARDYVHMLIPRAAVVVETQAEVFVFACPIVVHHFDLILNK